MDEERHKYKLNTYTNLTSPFSTSAYSQYIIQSILKDVFDDDDFEFNVKVSSMPITKVIEDKGNYLAAKDHLETKVIVVRSTIVTTWSRLAFIVLGITVFANAILNVYILGTLINERLSQKKLFA